MSRNLAISAAGVGIAVLLLALASRVMQQADTQRPESSGPVESSVSPQRQLDDRGAWGTHEEGRSRVVESPKVRLVSGTVLSRQTGLPLGGVELRILPFALDLTGTLRNLDREALRDPGTRTTTNDHGQFQAQVLSAHPRLFVTARFPGFATVTHESLGVPLVLELEPADMVRVLVQSQDSTPIAGALVTQLALTDHGSLGTSYPLELERLLNQSGVTGEDGTVSFSSLGRATHFVAELGAQRSLPSEAKNSATLVTLTLRDTAQLFGSVSSRSADSALGQAAVAVLRGDGYPESAVLGSDDVEGEVWGPITVPIPDSGTVRLKATARGTVPAYELVQGLEPGAKVRVDFDLDAAERLHLLVLAEDGTPIGGASAFARWGTPAAWRYSRAKSSATGLAELDCPTGNLVSVGARAPEFFPDELSEVQPSGTTESPQVLTLLRSGKLTGSCIFHGLPPDDFEITYWVAGRSIYRQARFADSPDGSFAIDPVPAGPLQVLATCVDGQTATVTVEIVPGEQHNIELKFGASVAVDGRVIDGSTGAPISAEIRLHAVSSGFPMYQYGPTHHADESGVFSFSGLSLGENYLSVSAAGYADMSTIVAVPNVGTLDLGSIRLQRDVIVELHFSGHTHLGDCWASIETGPQQLVPASGLVSFEGIAPGSHRVYFVEPDQFGFNWDVEVVASDIQRIDCTIPSGVRLKMTATTAGDTGLPIDGRVSVTQSDERGRSVSRSSKLPESGLATIDRLHPGEAVVMVIDSDHQVLAVEHTVLTSGPPTELRIELGSNDRELLILDLAGIPVPNAALYLSIPSSETDWAIARTADSKGQVSLVGIDLPSVVAGVSANDRHDYHNTLDLSSDVPITVTMDAESRFTISITDGLLPLSGIDVYCNAAGTKFYLPSLATNAAGQITWPSISAGPYEISVEDPVLWPLTREINVSGADTQVSLDVRRRGNLLLTVRNEFGTAVSNAAVSLTSNEFSQSVSTWLADGLINTSTGTLRTDDSGKLRVSGVPNGEYSLNVNGEDTSITIPAWSTLEHEIALDPVH